MIFSNLSDLMDQCLQLNGSIHSTNAEYNKIDVYNRSISISEELRFERVGQSDKVALFMEKSEHTVAAIAAVLRSGAAYVPIPINYPQDRVRFMLEDCGAKVILCSDVFFDLMHEVLEEIPFRVKVICVDQIKPSQKSLKTEEKQKITPQDLAYVFYTSGSTGKPKGVMLTHENALSFIYWARNTFDLKTNDTFCSYAPLHFGISIFDLYVSLLTGGDLVLIDSKSSKNPLDISNTLIKKKVSIWYSTPSVINWIMGFEKKLNLDLKHLRLVLFAGEVFHLKQLRRAKNIWSNAEFYNLYGPTEANVICYYKIPEFIEKNRDENYPIGRPCSPHVEVKLIDHRSSRESLEMGELCVSGKSVFSGYMNLPEKTKISFYQIEGKSWYRTGDIAERDKEGYLHFRSRIDRMVKRLGHRIELDEIEYNLKKIEGIRESAVISFQDSIKGQKIISFYSFDEGISLSEDFLRKKLRESLPKYMLPDLFVVLNEIPKTSSDKISYSELKQIVERNTTF